MADVMQPDKSSRENIQLFLATIEDVEIRNLVESHLEDILAVGADLDPNRDHRNAVFQAIQQLIEQRLGE
jgi:cellulose biosynthesis protein BcsQ